MESQSTAQRGGARRPNFVVRLFRGDIRLFITYWFFGELVGGIFFAIRVGLIDPNTALLSGSPVGRWSVLSFIVFQFAYNVFMFIAIWRSAGKYVGRRLWAVLARVWLVFGACVFAAGLIAGVVLHFNPNVMGKAHAAFDEAQDASWSRKFSKGLPAMVDADTRLDRISVRGRDEYRFYTLVHVSAEDVDRPTFAPAMARLLRADGCRLSTSRWALKDGMNTVEVYRDKAGKIVASVEIRESDCKGIPYQSPDPFE